MSAGAKLLDPLGEGDDLRGRRHRHQAGAGRVAGPGRSLGQVDAAVEQLGEVAHRHLAGTVGDVLADHPGHADGFGAVPRMEDQGAKDAIGLGDQACGAGNGASRPFIICETWSVQALDMTMRTFIL